ncbi:MAG: MBL fold metallo-hydrolase [Candidatus Aminicenantes bacterium]|jgi:7,8-dihydropterin-6-yl-methyl-4-(beta-D-ribofuranosyl)aminobenzene 5'-phosphate synthase
MKLTVLVDNNTLIDRYFYAEPGIALYIEEGGKRILLDVGYSDIFIKNAQKMNIDLRTLDYVVLSHGHLDHTWGLDPLIRLYTESQIESIPHKKPTVVAHPLVFVSKMFDDMEIGSLFSREKLSKNFPVKLSKDPVWLTERLLYLGEIERTNDFEGKKPIGTLIKPDGEEPDYLYDDTALAYKSPNGLVIITGCSHSGICNIVEQAKRLCKEERVIDIVGGLHLLDPPEEQLQGTLEYLKKLAPEQMHPCHCTDLNSKIALSKVVNLKEVGVGLMLEYE